MTYNSNITRIPEEALELWPEFRKVSVCASLDGIGPVNEYIRHPSKWEEIEKNLRFLDRERAQARRHERQHSRHDPDLQHPEHLRALSDMVREFRFISPYVFMDLVMGKPYLDAQILPESYRKLAVERIDRFIAWLTASGSPTIPDQLEIFLARVNSIRNYVLAGERPELAGQFRRATEIFDRHRKQRLADYIPDLAPFYEQPDANPMTCDGASVASNHAPVASQGA